MPRHQNTIPHQNIRILDKSSENLVQTHKNKKNKYYIQAN